MDTSSSDCRIAGEVNVIGIIFEVWPAEGKKQEYLDIAATLRPLLDQIDGFISIERFESLYEPGKILSLSFFRDQAAVEQWRTLEAHRIAQTTGRASVFRDYRLRVVSTIRDYGMFNRRQAPTDSLSYHDGSAESK
jgi:heme-degrading monooxygenase HmoA